MLKAASLVAVLAALQASPSLAETLKVALPQKGNWDTGIVEYGAKAGLFKDAGLDIEISYTQGGAATIQAVISGSVDVAMHTGLLGLIGAYTKERPYASFPPQSRVRQSCSGTLARRAGSSR